MDPQARTAATARNSRMRRAFDDSSEDPRPIGEKLATHLTEPARERTVRQAVAGARFCAVLLDDGGLGVVNICPDGCSSAAPSVAGGLPQPGTSAADVLAALGLRERAAIGLATANALANRSCHEGGRWDEARNGGDVLDSVELRPDDHVGMVGCFTPLVEAIRRRVRRLTIFERASRAGADHLPGDRAPEILPECSVALITATTLVNDTLDGLLAAARQCREVVLLGPSTPLVPEVFAAPGQRVTLLAGVVVTDPDELLRTVVVGGGTRDFKRSTAKVNVRVGNVS